MLIKKDQTSIEQKEYEGDVIEDKVNPPLSPNVTIEDAEQMCHVHEAIRRLETKAPRKSITLREQMVGMQSMDDVKRLLKNVRITPDGMIAIIDSIMIIKGCGRHDAAQILRRIMKSMKTILKPLLKLFFTTNLKVKDKEKLHVRATGRFSLNS